MYRFESDYVRIGKYVYNTCHEFFSISCESNRFWLYFNICEFFVNVLLFRDVFLVYFVVSWILSWFFFSWWRLVWGTRLFFTGIFFFVFGDSLSVSIESLFVIFHWLSFFWFFVVFLFSYWSRVLCIGLWNLVSR